ncbi:MAG: gas vesicle protein GvpG [Planctomycetota bacterium]
MLVADDILFFPFRGLLFVFKELHHAVQQEKVDEADRIRSELSELYMMLDTGRIDEDEFDAREEELLDRLEAIEAEGRSPDDDAPTITNQQPTGTQE